MRRIFLCSVIMTFCLATPVFSQFVVTDPALTQLSQITWAKELKQAYEQFKVLDNSRNILTESLDLYRKVSGLIQNSKMVLNVLKLQGEMLKISATECSRTDIYTQEGYNAYTKVLNDIMEESITSFDLLRTIIIKRLISPDLKMTDGERLKIIIDLDAKLRAQQDKLLDERARFNTVNDAIKRIAALKSDKS
jgi:hypothetical protein